jgi:antitoxin component of MazEF toxin-antitoxin module
MRVTEFEAKIRKVGDSLGIIIPSQVIRELRAKPNQKIRVVLPRRVDWSDLWGRFGSKTPTDRLLRAARTDRD